MNKFIMSYSCGKDSTLALYRMINKGNIPVALITTINKYKKKSCFHGVSVNLIYEISKSLDIPVVLIEVVGNDYTEKFTQALIYIKEKFGADSCAFGDIDLKEHRKWCTSRCDEANIESIFPLWEEDREELVYEFIDSGFKTIIKNVKLQCMGEEFLGKVLTKDVVKDIKETGSDVCGENGEYHTFVYDGPLFKYPINFKILNVIKNETHGFLEIEEIVHE